MSPRQRCIVAAAIVGLHALVVLVLTGQLLPWRVERPLADEALVYLGELPVEPPHTKAQEPAPDGERAARAPTPARPAPPAAITLPESAPTFDFDGEATQAAGEVVGDIVRHETRLCDDSGEPGSWLPKCKKLPHGFGWSEEPKRAGIEHGLPYLRLGKHCILVIGIIGCAVGAMPEANGHLFGDLKDPDRDRSSVPDIKDINAPVDLVPPHESVLRQPAAR